MTTRTSLGIDPDKGAEKFEIRNEAGEVIGYDWVFPEE
jgi:hypothetical protein